MGIKMRYLKEVLLIIYMLVLSDTSLYYIIKILKTKMNHQIPIHQLT